MSFYTGSTPAEYIAFMEQFGTAYPHGKQYLGSVPGERPGGEEGLDEFIDHVSHILWRKKKMMLVLAPFYGRRFLFAETLSWTKNTDVSDLVFTEPEITAKMRSEYGRYQDPRQRAATHREPGEKTQARALLTE